MKVYGKPVFILPAFLFFLSVTTAAAQSAADDSMMFKKAVYNAISVYHQSVGTQSGLLNGSQYGRFPFSFAANGNPFFKEDKPGLGTVVYDSVLYERQQLQFDEVQDALIMQDSIRRIQLLNQRVQAFTLFDNNFIRIVKDSLNGISLKTGFYNILYTGNISLLKKEEKMVKEDVSTGELLRYIEVYKYYYIKKGHTYYAVSGKGSLLDYFTDRKKEIRQYIRKNKLNYRKDSDNMLIKVITYYDQLIK